MLSSVAILCTSTSSCETLGVPSRIKRRCMIISRRTLVALTMGGYLEPGLWRGQQISPPLAVRNDSMSCCASCWAVMPEVLPRVHDLARERATTRDASTSRSACRASRVSYILILKHLDVRS